VKILEAKEGLLHNYLDQSDWDAGLVVTFDEGEEVFPEWLKNDADMDILGCAVMERIEERNDMLMAWVRPVGFLHSTEQLDLVPGGFGISARRLDDFQGRMLVGPGEDECRDGTGARLGNKSLLGVVDQPNG